MPDIALRPRSATELVDAAFQLYRRDPLPFITGLALIYVPWMLILAATGMAGLAAGDADLVSFSLMPLFLLALGNALAYMLGTGITTVLANDAYFGRPVDLGKAIRAAAVRAPAILIATLVVGFIITFGFFLLILPGFYFFGRLFATKQAILLENASAPSAIDRSWKLTKGHVRRVINAMGLVVLLNLAFTIGVRLTAGIVPSQIVQLLIGTLVSVVVYPMFGIIETLLYYDIRIRREGFDIEYLAAASPATAEQSAPT